MWWEEEAPPHRSPKGRSAQSAECQRCEEAVGFCSIIENSG